MYGSAQRRPWSPQPRHDDYDLPHEPYDIHYDPYIPHSDPSDVSVHALDLADYAATLRRHHPDPFPPFPSSPAFAESTHSLPLSSVTSSSRRPILSPPSPIHTRPTRTGTSLDDTHSTPRTEVDISHFPPWTQGWYDQPSRPKIFAHSHDPFDPDYTTRYNAKPPHAHSPSHQPRSYDSIHPWDDGTVVNPPSYSHHDNAPVDPETKEARMRLLEREFDNKANNKALGDTEGAPGTVDMRGRLVTRGPKKRALMRCTQILLALAAAIPPIYAAIVIKLDPPAPPAGKPPVFVLYVLSCITVVVLLYAFVLRPCCGGRRKRRKDLMHDPLGPMVLPVGGDNRKEKKKHKKGKGAPPGGDVQVNLIVDPTMFNPSEETSTDDDEGTMLPGGYDAKSKKRRKRAKRRGILAGLAMEADWKLARSWLKKVTAVDVLALILWGAAFILVMLGNRCPAGKFNGWCDTYNVATAASCLLCLAFGVSLFFDVQDLHDSKLSPRTR